jgi:hypothetical protein
VQLFVAEANEINMDTNLAVVINADNSIVGIGRTGGGSSGIVVHLVTATDWRNASSYTGRWRTMLFPNTTVVPDAGLEDPMLYTDARGVYHAVFHNQIEQDDEKLCGGHAFSVDGLQWTFTGTAWGSTVQFAAQGAVGSDGQQKGGNHSGASDGVWESNSGMGGRPAYSYSFSRRERPHLVFGDLQDPFRITALTTGVQYGAGSPIAKDGQDACFTLLQPVN